MDGLLIMILDAHGEGSGDARVSVSEGFWYFVVRRLQRRVFFFCWLWVIGRDLLMSLLE